MTVSYFLKAAQIQFKRAVATAIRWLHCKKMKDGFEMELETSECGQAQLAKNRTIEPLTAKLFQRLLASDDVYVDIGANVGFHTLLARSRIGSSGQVIAVEPLPYNGDRLLRNWLVNGWSNLSLYVAACGREDGLCRLPNQSLFDTTRLSRVEDLRGAGQPQEYVVSALRLEAILNREAVKKIKLLKIDVEGYELEVLEGLGNAFPLVENLIVEILSADEKHRATQKAIVTLLRTNGYELRDVLGNPWDLGNPLCENNLWAAKPR